MNIYKASHKSSYFKIFDLLIISLIFIFLVIMAGGRDVFVGTDTSAYHKIFDIINFRDYPAEALTWEPLYIYLNRLVHFFDAYDIILVSTLLMIFYFISKESENKYSYM